MITNDMMMRSILDRSPRRASALLAAYQARVESMCRQVRLARRSASRRDWAMVEMSELDASIAANGGES